MNKHLEVFEFILNYLLAMCITCNLRTVTETQGIDLELGILIEFQRKTVRLLKFIAVIRVHLNDQKWLRNVETK